MFTGTLIFHESTSAKTSNVLSNRTCIVILLFKSETMRIEYLHYVMWLWSISFGWLPQSIHCSGHRRTPQCSDMTGHHIHPQHKAGHPAGTHPPHPGEHWGRRQWSTCPSSGRTCECKYLVKWLFIRFGWDDETRWNHSFNLPESQEGNSVPSPPSLITDSWMVTVGNSFQHRPKTKLKLKCKIVCWTADSLKSRESWTH